MFLMSTATRKVNKKEFPIQTNGNAMALSLLPLSGNTTPPAYKSTDKIVKAHQNSLRES